MAGDAFNFCLASQGPVARVMDGVRPLRRDLITLESDLVKLVIRKMKRCASQEADQGAQAKGDMRS